MFMILIWVKREDTALLRRVRQSAMSAVVRIEGWAVRLVVGGSPRSVGSPRRVWVVRHERGVRWLPVQKQTKQC